MDYNREELVNLLKAVLAGDDIGVDWDELALYVNSKDDFLRYWARKILVVEELYPPARPTQLFNEDGLRTAIHQFELITPELFGLVTDALKVGNGFDDGNDESKVTGRRLPPRQYLDTLLVDIDFHAVNPVILLHHATGDIGV